MELIAEDVESVTIKMSRRPEYAMLSGCLDQLRFELEGDNVDLERLGWSKKEYPLAFLESFFEMADQLRKMG